jgi:hypothetical protein
VTLSRERRNVKRPAALACRANISMIVVSLNAAISRYLPIVMLFYIHSRYA